MSLFPMLIKHYFYYGIVMKTTFAIILAVVLSGFATQAQSLDDWLNTGAASAQEKQEAVQKVNDLLASLRSDAPRDIRQLRKVFRKVEGTVLKQYEAYSDFSSLFTEGKYDCLTATALFSHLLLAMGYDFKVVETNYHIFILAKTSEGDVLLETTDRLSGFVTDADAIAKRVGTYRRNELSGSLKENNYRYHCDLYQTVEPNKLTGLLLFNQAVKAYNRGSWLVCARSLEQAHTQYATVRSLELCEILVRTLIERKEISIELRSACLVHLKSIVVDQSAAVAANQALD